MNFAKPLLVVVEGIDGAGKSTLAANLSLMLADRGHPSLVIRPLAGDQVLLDSVHAAHADASPGPALEDAYQRFLGAYFSYRLLDSARVRIRPAISAGTTVICDRYIGSHRVNQRCFGTDVSAFDPLFARLPQADVTIYLRVPVQVASERLQRRVLSGAGDHRGFLAAAATAFEGFAARERWTVVDGTLPEQTIRESGLAAVGNIDSPSAVC